MPPRMLHLAAAAAAIALAACGQAKPTAGGNPLSAARPQGRGVVDDPRHKPLPCLRRLGLPVIVSGRTNLLIGSAGSQARVMFEPTPGAAQAAQIEGQSEAAEVIGSALLYPGPLADHQLKPIEKCLAADVEG